MKLAWVVDTETTGVDPEKDAVVELGGVLVDLENLEVIRTYETLVDPGRPIPPQASAVHHIVDRHIEEARPPTLDEAVQTIVGCEEDYHYVVAHNAKFDRAFLPQLSESPWICTYKCALRAFPDAPSHSNQVLRYFLGLSDPTSSKFAHRALYDAEVTAQLLFRMAERATSSDWLDRMLKVSSEPALLRKINFGKHAGKLWSEVPPDYLRWMSGRPADWDEDKLHTARYWLDRLR